MKDTDQPITIRIADTAPIAYPANSEADNWFQDRAGQYVNVKEYSPRDLEYHRRFFAFINNAYDFMHKDFKKVVPKDHFYRVIKLKQGRVQLRKYIIGDIVLTDTEIESISFQKMSQSEFQIFARESVVTIFEFVAQYFNGKGYDATVNLIENNFKNIICKL